MARYGLDRKVAFVTGAASGIGRAAALAFVREGVRVALVDRDGHGGEETLGMVRATGGDGLFVRADITRTSDVVDAIDRTANALGGLDFAFNDAGIEGANATTADYDEDEWDRVIATNLDRSVAGEISPHVANLRRIHQHRRVYSCTSASSARRSRGRAVVFASGSHITERHPPGPHPRRTRRAIAGSSRTRSAGSARR